ncbi:MAG TPA: c-type cytochrome, partial [Geobacteraceae bacterium]|nr:c-type cytochrome [Geobacteraceae bacterium]
MKGPGVLWRSLARGAVQLGACILATVCWSAAVAGEARGDVAGLSREETLRLGERLYRTGILPSGKPVTAFVQGDVAVEGTMFSCVSCHMRSGFGSYEGGVMTTPTTGKYLYQPVYILRQLSPAEKETIPKYFRPQFEAPPKRPAYTDETLAAALRTGVDPSGRAFNYVMPRYSLNDRDMAILIAYLKSLAAEPSPGVTETTVRFATVVTDDVSSAERDALMTTLENYARGRNVMAAAAETRSKRGFLSDWMDAAYRRKLSISRWELKGPPATWRGQLEEYYRKEPVFALLGGISNGDWRPIHDFSEEHHIPCLLPLTDF